MSEQSSNARLLCLRLPGLVDDSLLINYAQKALLFPTSDGSRTRVAPQVPSPYCSGVSYLSYVSVYHRCGCSQAMKRRMLG